MPRRPTIDLYAYLDLAAYLRDVYAHRKAASRAFSYRSFGRRVGLRSPNHLKRVIDGERPLTEEMAPRYAAALDLDADETEYFCALAAFSRAGTASEKSSAYQRLASSRGYRRVQRLEARHAAYHERWYVPVIRELAALPDFVADPGTIAARLIPPIGRAEAQEALDTLVALGMLAPDADGRLRPAQSVVSTGPETRGVHIFRYHRAMLERAAGSMDLVPPDLRDISSLTFCTSEEGLRELKSRIQKFRRELVAFLSEHEAGGDRVVQLNVQVFPLSGPPAEVRP